MAEARELGCERFHEQRLLNPSLASYQRGRYLASVVKIEIAGGYVRSMRVESLAGDSLAAIG